MKRGERLDSGLRQVLVDPPMTQRDSADQPHPISANNSHVQHDSPCFVVNLFSRRIILCDIESTAERYT
jgi:hypothetical protein